MNIGFILLNNHGGKGGMESVLEQTCMNLQKKGINSYVYLLYKPKHLEFLDKFQNIYYLSAPRYLEESSKLPRFAKKYLHKRYIQKNYDTLLKRMSDDHLDALVVLNITKQFLNHFDLLKQFKDQNNVPLLSWTHSSISDTAKKILEQISKKASIFERHLAISKAIKAEIYDVSRSKKISLTYNPISAAPKIQRDSKRFIFIGRIDKNKQVEELIQNFSKIKGDWSFDIYGSTGSEESDQKIHQLIKSLELDNKIFFHGWTENPWTKINVAGTLLLNSKKEGLPLCIAEAMIRGIPCLSSNYFGEASEIIKNNENGWLYEIGDMKTWQSKVQAIVDGQLQLPDQESIQKSVLHFESAQVAERFIDALNQTIKEYSN
ncbi:glycosyltransferase [Ignatzschineria cameli]|uniref:Glycosyl transferase family 1 domain-containing protein n=1 Tax=Ignatzschineria cameli TaxID=2182793 RepID=A0ABX5L0R9_9GAMM|nr:glycosyltransferase [Ignatzschineria cameli]PWD88634.1 hypothetical protein DC079_08810 [Ignatzschineria cameli]PWD89563.1 hypothetical protein DC081_08930 [Ignatzschineria cameli]PWD90188.1 hypothetical protein DC078_08865 [Ignatzschineria cameli]